MTHIGHKPDEIQGSRSIGRRVVAAVIAAIVYAVAATIWVPPQAIRPAAAGGGAAADFPSAGAGSV